MQKLYVLTMDYGSYEMRGTTVVGVYSDRPQAELAACEYVERYNDEHGRQARRRYTGSDWEDGYMSVSTLDGPWDDDINSFAIEVVELDAEPEVRW